MTYAPTTHKFAMGIGAAGAMVEVTADVLLNEGGVSRRWGRQSTFSDTSPGQFSFTLDNRDGKYTPDNPNSTLATKVTEGMRVSWELNGTLRSGKISGTQLIFPSEGKADAARLRVTVSDVLADAARTDIDSLPQSVVMASQPYSYWPMDDAAGALFPREASGNNFGGLRKLLPDLAGADVVFGSVSPVFGWPEARMVFPSTPLSFYDGTGLISSLSTLAAGEGSLGPYPYASGNLGWWSFFVAPEGNFLTQVKLDGSLPGVGVFSTYVDITASGISYLYSGVAPGTSIVSGPFANGSSGHVAFGGSYVFAAGVWTFTYQLYVDGVAAPGSISATSPVDPRTFKWAFSVRTGGAPDLVQATRVSHVAHTPSRILNIQVAGRATEADRLVAIASAVPGLTLDTLPSDLGLSALGAPGSGSALDLFNTVIRGEQGHIWSDTSGTLLAPVEKVKVRARTRPEAVTSSFSTSTDIEGAPDLQRNTTNMVSAVTVTGPTGKVTVYQRDLEPRVGSANTSASVAFVVPADLEAWGQDRILRGVNRGIDVVSFNIDPGGASTNRWAELMSLTPGLRYRVADLPVAQLGVSTWDGWFLGAAESHDGDRSMFTLYFEPVLERSAIYDTDRYMAGGVLSLSSNITNSATTMSIATSAVGTTFTTAGGDLPLDVVMGTEQMRVTAVTSATPQVFTVSRGVNGTTAVAHTAGELLELVTPTLYAY